MAKSTTGEGATPADAANAVLEIETEQIKLQILASDLVDLMSIDLDADVMSEAEQVVSKLSQTIAYVKKLMPDQ